MQPGQEPQLQEVEKTRWESIVFLRGDSREVLKWNWGVNSLAGASLGGGVRVLRLRNRGENAPFLASVDGPPASSDNHVTGIALW